ncbi:MAG TPA: DUF6544 family protein [Candidatus Limnocylindrales bacterium]|nr:DUF6544 family protein [Candidatus Limnocylindrales bacterium]
MRALLRSLFFVFLFVFGPLVALALIVRAGLRQKPAPFPPYPARPAAPPETIDWPDDLPAPVRHAFETVLGGQPQVITTAVVSGRATLRIANIPLQARFRFIHEAGQNYRHLIEVTLFGRPVMHVNESFINGYARMNLGPMGTFEGTPQLFQAATLGMWSEAIWFPSLLLTDPRLRWVAVDDRHARLYVPSGEREDCFLITFDPITGRIAAFDSLRYRDADASAQMLGWHCAIRSYAAFNGVLVPAVSTIQWSDMQVPWAEWHVEEVVYNADVSAYFGDEGASGAQA